MTTGDFTAFHDLASCWRGDWSDFDGRTLRVQLEEAERVARGQLTLADFRIGNRICARYGRHWAQYCADYGCDQ